MAAVVEDIPAQEGPNSRVCKAVQARPAHGHTRETERKDLSAPDVLDLASGRPRVSGDDRALVEK